MRNVSETKPPYTKQMLPRLIFWEKTSEVLHSLIPYLQHGNAIFFPRFALKKLKNMHIEQNFYPWYVFVKQNSFEYKYIVGFIAMEILINIVSKENLMTPSWFGDHCGNHTTSLTRP